MAAATLIITNARIITMDTKLPFAEAISITGDRISNIGSAENILALANDATRIVDAKGKTVMPGIIESHVHLFGGAVELELLNISPFKDLGSIATAVRAYRQTLPAASTVFVIGATHAQFGEGVAITRQLLDQVVSDVPFVMECFDHHTVWANTCALERAGIIGGRDLPPGNEIVLDGDGMATGELREPAAYLPVLQLTATKGRDFMGMMTGEDPVPPPTTDERESDLHHIKRGIAYANALGITSMHNMDGNRYQLELLTELEKRGELNARVEIPFHQKNYFALERVDEAAQWREEFKSEMIHCDRIKVFMDGVMETLTAFMLNDYPGHPGNTGSPLFTADAFNAVAARADGLGLQIAVHAIGDGAVRRTLDGFEFARDKNGTRDSRHRIEHIELIDPADIPRLKALGVVASLQPNAGLGVIGNPREPILSRVGDKLPYAYAWQADTA